MAADPRWPTQADLGNEPPPPFEEETPEEHARARRNWTEGVLLVMLLGVYLAVFFLFEALGDMKVRQDHLKDQQTEILGNQGEGQIRGYKSRAIACESVIIDNDRTFALAEDCTEDALLPYYPPEICSLLTAPALCGTEFTPSRFRDPAP